MTTTITRPRGTPALLYAAGAFGLAWNAFGLFQFWNSVTASRDHLVSMGMTAEQAALYAGLPVWMHVAFALGAAGGVAGSALLLLRRGAAAPVFAASLAGYMALYVGDIVEGVFALFGMGQAALLTAVVLIAAALLWIARRARALLA